MPFSVPYFTYFEKLGYAGGKWTRAVASRRTRMISLCFVYVHIFTSGLESGGHQRSSRYTALHGC